MAEVIEKRGVLSPKEKDGRLTIIHNTKGQ